MLRKKTDMNLIHWKIINRENFIALVYWSIILAVCLLLVSHAAFGIIDDHHFTESILSGKNLKFFIVPESGRFYPLDGQEYNLISFLSKDPVWFYMFNALELMLIAWLLIKIGKLAVNDSSVKLPYVIAFLIIFSPGFATAWTRLLVPERNILLLFAIFVYNYLLFKKSYRYKHFVIGILAAAVSLFYKETSFIFIGAIGIIGSIFDSVERRNKIFYFALCLISVIWLMMYITFFIWSHPFKCYAQTQVSYLKTIPACLGFYLLFDPLIIISMLSIMYIKFSELKKGINTKFKTDDILLASGLIYVLAYFMLKLYGYHYLLPVVCVLPYILLKNFNFKDLKSHKSKVCVAVFFTIYFIFTFPTAVDIFYSNKIIPYNFKLTRQKIVKTCKDWNGENKISLAGINEYRSDEILVSLNKYIKYDLNLINKVNSELEGGKIVNCKYVVDLFTRNCGNPAEYFKKGDILLLTPYDSVSMAGHLKSLKEYSLIYKTSSLNLGFLSAKTLLKYVITKYKMNFGTYKIINGTEDKYNFYVYVRN